MDPALCETAALEAVIDPNEGADKQLKGLLEKRKKLMVDHLTWFDTREHRSDVATTLAGAIPIKASAGFGESNMTSNSGKKWVRC